MIEFGSYMLDPQEMKLAVKRPSLCEEYARKVSDATERMIETFIAENPDRHPVVSHEWDDETLVMTVKVRDGGPMPQPEPAPEEPELF